MGYDWYIDPLKCGIRIHFPRTVQYQLMACLTYSHLQKTGSVESHLRLEVIAPLQERLARIEREKEEELERMKLEAAARREEVERLEQEAEANRNAPVDDSKIVEQMFGFLPEGEQVQTADDSKL